MSSRQYRWQLKKIAEGRCVRCGKKRKHYRRLCDSCELKHRLYRRKRFDAQPWSSDKRGCPPRVKPLL
jgi:predicted amidophosphoribosyltransferase